MSMLHQLDPTPRQLELGQMVRDTASRHFETHGVWPTCVFASPDWFDEMTEAAPLGTQLLVIGGVPVFACMGLVGVCVMSRA